MQVQCQMQFSKYTGKCSISEPILPPPTHPKEGCTIESLMSVADINLKHVNNTTNACVITGAQSVPEFAHGREMQ